MFARGLKGKCLGHQEDVEGALRQSLLDMSLAKLQLCHMLVEPNLCRSILIANMVWQIQEEMTQDGTWRTPQAAGWAPLDRLVFMEILCRAAWEQEGARPASGLGDGHAQGPVSVLCPVTSAQMPRHPQREERLGDGWKRGQPLLQPGHSTDRHDGGAGPGPCEGLEGLAPVTPGPSSSCKSDLGELDHVVEILVET
uniref:SERTA domain-containing protein n=1 Tax=Nomascus leucogenys TaxID=61853 RepID=A0A2I3G213_NOMLE